MPIRDVDMFTSNTDKNIRTFGNRGASGIDGLIASAVGTSYTNDKTRNILISFSPEKIRSLMSRCSICINLIGILYEKKKDHFKTIHTYF